MVKKLHVKKGDTVVVTTGKDRGKKSKILQSLPKEDRVIVEGVNVLKKHSRPTQKMPQGGIIEKEGPIHVSNVMPFCAKCGKGVRVAHQELANGTKVRKCVKCGEVFDK